MGKYHTVSQGECFSSLAHQYGFESYRTIYNHAENTELVKLRQNPNILHPHDVVYIPDNELKEYDGATEQTHRFVLKREKTMFRIVLKDKNEKPFADTRYELSVDKKVYDGVTDGAGKIEREINANARQGHVTIYVKDDDGNEIVGIIPLEFKHLDPVTEPSGVQARLKNLGFMDSLMSGMGEMVKNINGETNKNPDFTGSLMKGINGSMGEMMKAAVRAFQKKHNLPETGEACSATREKLRQAHDWE